MMANQAPSTSTKRAGAARLFPLVVALFFLAFAVAADPPTLEFLYPAGGERGTTVTLSVGGKLEPWPVKLWCDDPALTLEPQADKGVVKLQIAPGAAEGPRLVRVFNEEGASRPRVFMVSRIASLAEKEPNDSHKTAQKIESAPVTVEGRLERTGDVDSYAVELKAGQWLVARAEGYGLGSPIDPTLHLRDAAGGRLTQAYDTRNLDPMLAWRAGADGTYILQIDAFAHIPRFDVRNHGDKSAVYRLEIHTGPYAHHTWPLAARRELAGGPTTLRLVGWNFQTEGAACTEIALESITPDPRDKTMLAIAEAPSANTPRAMIRDFEQFIEAEPNEPSDQDTSTTATAQAIAFPAGVSGVIQSPRDRDRYRFSVKKSEPVRVVTRSASLDFALDPVVRILDATGKELAAADDAGAALDPALAWAAPEDGDYVIEVMDRFEKGGEDFTYYLELAPPQPRLTATVEKDALRLDTGTTAALKVNISLIDGFTAPLVATAVDLPQGVSSTAPSVPEKGGEVTLLLTAAPDAPAHTGAFRVVVLSTNPDAPLAKPAEASLEVELPVGPQIVPSIASLWLTVATPKPPEPKK